MLPSASPKLASVGSQPKRSSTLGTRSFAGEGHARDEGAEWRPAAQHHINRGIGGLRRSGSGESRGKKRAVP